jgi:hypothetical protein
MHDTPSARLRLRLNVHLLEQIAQRILFLGTVPDVIGLAVRGAVVRVLVPTRPADPVALPFVPKIQITAAQVDLRQVHGDRHHVDTLRGFDRRKVGVHSESAQ